MPLEADRQASNVIPPRQSNTAGEGVTILAATTSAANTAIPRALHDRYVYLQAEGDKIWVNFGPNGSPNVDKSKAGGATFTAGTNYQNAITIPNGSRIAVRLHKVEHYQISWQADASASKLLVYPATQQGPKVAR
jgi:hypothetical protein